MGGIKSIQSLIKYSESLIKKTKSISDSYVAVGLPEEKTSGKIYRNGMSVIQIGAIHEFGTKDIPRRSFLKDAFDAESKSINKTIKDEYKKVVDGISSEDKALGRIGLKAENISKGAFRSDGYGNWEPIKDSTKKRKGSSKPLFDTGTLRNSITHVVRKK